MNFKFSLIICSRRVRKRSKYETYDCSPLKIICRSVNWHPLNTTFLFCNAQREQELPLHRAVHHYGNTEMELQIYLDYSRQYFWIEQFSTLECVGKKWHDNKLLKFVILYFTNVLLDETWHPTDTFVETSDRIASKYNLLLSQGQIRSIQLLILSIQQSAGVPNEHVVNMR